MAGALGCLHRDCKGGKEEGRRAFVNENETQVVASGVFLVDFSECGGEIEATEK